MTTVIGGGPAGRLASIHLALKGKEVLLIDRRKELGGQCLHKGCMVICALNDIARSLEDCRNYEKEGIFKNIPAADYSSAIIRMRENQKKIAKVLERETKDYGVDVACGEASVDGRDVVLNGEKLDRDNVIIATGSIPAVPPFEGGDLPGVYTPHTITGLESLPDSISIVGGGVIAAEYAYIFSSFGVKTTIISRSSFLRGKPEQLIKSVKKELAGVDIRENTAIKRITGDDSVEGVEITERGSDSRTEAGAVLIAAGLVPNSGMVSGIPKGSSGGIIVNEKMETGVSGVYAAGDVTGPPFLTPVARLEGIIAADSILGIEGRKIPGCIPQSIKLRNEHSYFEKGEGALKEISFPAPAGPGSFWYVSGGNTGRAMVSVEADTGDVSGAYLGSPGSGPALAYMAYMISRQAGAPDFSEYLEVHPSTDGIPSIVKYINRIKEKND